MKLLTYNPVPTQEEQPEVKFSSLYSDPTRTRLVQLQFNVNLKLLLLFLNGTLPKRCFVDLQSEVVETGNPCYVAYRHKLVLKEHTT